MKAIFTFFVFFISIASFGQQLVYKAINPAFGGETFNHQWLLNAANAQNSFKDPDAASNNNRSTIDQFAESLNRQLLSQISRSLLGSQLEGGLEPGTFNFGSLSLEVFESGDGLVINILDTSTGEETQIIVPNP
ncbi:curli production assembly/transport component CsgF [Aequorivita echinoideorum]|uniref:Curli production assembly/transport component CsgF n=1 Tax=Aequorivita echinoideorum TaxID=1549647 RepID=A0ABS5S8S2_9FLAO|nr:curli production assembly/transport component CsgF [Aequorivita echinoideorum]MBT0608275.1 curli assembly protein CsgF [Aequorivita echinoideorum]